MAQKARKASMGCMLNNTNQQSGYVNMPDRQEANVASNYFDDLSHLSIPQPISEAYAVFQSAPYPSTDLKLIATNDLLCQSTHLHDTASDRHFWVSRALVGEKRADLDFSHLVSPPVIVATWDDSNGEKRQPWWLLCHPSRIHIETRTTWDIVPTFTMLSHNPNNEAKELAICRWCSAVHPYLHLWGNKIHT